MTSAMTILQTHLSAIHACEEAREWAGGRTPQQAWDECERVDWLLWWAARTKGNERTAVVLAACACAITVLKYLPKGEKRPLLAIRAAETWAHDPTPENKEKARDAASDAYAASDAAYAASAAASAASAASDAAYAAASAASDAAYAAASAAAYAAYAAAYAAASAAAYAAASAASDAAYAASDAAYAAASAAARNKAHLRMCQLVRKLLVCPLETGGTHHA